MSITILRGNALALPLADESVDLVVTSPPYFGLRSYQDGGEHYQGQIGAEATPAEFVDALIAATREMVRVLKPSGSIWVNLGDKYATGATPGPQPASTTMTGGAHKGVSNVAARKLREGVRAKSLLGIPWRYAIRCIDDLGLILRAEVIWSKPNGLPESVTDRVRRSHETWFHFTKQPRYFSAVDEIREPHKSEPGREGVGALGGQKTLRPVGPNSGSYNALGALPGSVWTVATEPLRVPESLGVDHFAAFPTEWPRRIITGWSPAGVCVECGFLLGSTYDSGLLGVRKDLRSKQAQGPSQAVLRQDLRQSAHREEPCEHEVPQTDDTGLRGGLEAGSPNGAEKRLHDGASPSNGRAPRAHAGAERGRAPQERGQDGQSFGEPGASGEGRARRLAEATPQAVRVPSLQRHDPDVRDALSCPNCGCDSFRPAVIADPFGGTGTTALVADVLGRHGISVDLSADYCRLAQWRTNDPGQRAKAARVEPVDAPSPDQPDLFEDPA